MGFVSPGNAWPRCNRATDVEHMIHDPGGHFLFWKRFAEDCSGLQSIDGLTTIFY
jgi:hypothetical protein